jgi:hypothetical protein
MKLGSQTGSPPHLLPPLRQPTPVGRYWRHRAALLTVVCTITSVQLVRGKHRHGPARSCSRGVRQRSTTQVR